MDDASLENQYFAVIEELCKTPTPTTWRAEELDKIPFTGSTANSRTAIKATLG